MKTLRERIASAAIRQPSISRCGLRPMITRSLNAPGSDSSALMTRYEGRAPLRSTRLALRPVGKPAPPRPRSVDVTSSSISASGSIARAFSSASYPPTARYSSSCVRSRSSTWASRRSRLGTELLDQRGNVLGRDRLPVAPVDDGHRRVAAAAGALDRPERHLAVLRRLARGHGQLVLERLDDALRADQRTREVRADLDRVPPDRLQVVHVVERRDRLAVRGRQVECVRNLAQRLRRQPAVALLRRAQRRHDRGARVGIQRAKRLDLVEQLCHLSTSPIKVSREPTIAIMSAINDSRRHLALGDAVTLRDDLEVMNERLHRGVELFTRRQDDLSVVRNPRLALHLLEPVEALRDDSRRLAHLVHAHAVAVVHVAVRIHGNAEVDLVVREIRLVAPHVPVDAGRAQHRPGLPESDRVVRAQQPDTLRALEPDLVAIDELLVLVDGVRHLLDELAA